jgi:hypothetical protein
LPLIVIVLARLQMAINVSALPVSPGPIAEDLNAPSTAAATALLLYSLFVAAFVMLGAKTGKLPGERLVLQVGVVVHGAAMALMAARPSPGSPRPRSCRRWSARRRCGSWWRGRFPWRRSAAVGAADGRGDARHPSAARRAGRRGGVRRGQQASDRSDSRSSATPPARWSS